MSDIINQHFPDQLIDPALKDYAWHLQYAQAAYADYFYNGPRAFYKARDKYQTIKSYASGTQSTSKYLPLLDIDENASDSWLNIDLSILRIMPKYRRIALKKLNKMQYRINVSAIDAISADIKDTKYAALKAKIIRRADWMTRYPDEPMPPDLMPMAGEPEDLDELEVSFKMGFKHAHAMDMEKGVRGVFNINKVDNLRRLVRRDLWDYGVGGYKDDIGLNGSINVRRVLVENLIVGRGIQEDYSDAPYIGEVIWLTIGELRKMAGTSFTEEQYKEMAAMATDGIQPAASNRVSFGGRRNEYESIRIPVLDLEFYSTDIHKYEKRYNRYGNMVVGKADYNAKPEPGKEIIENSDYTVRGVKWVMGTKYCFGYGKVYDVKRDDLGRPRLSYTLQSTEWDDQMVPLSKTEEGIPIADQIQLAWYKLQNVMAEARPKGIAIEIGALENVPLGQGGEIMQPLELIDLYAKRGILVYRRIDASGRGSVAKPIEELNNGIGEEANRWFSTLQSLIQTLRDITGMNELTDGSTPDPKTLTTIAKLAAEGTNNALGDIVEAERLLFERLAESTYCRLAHVLRYKEEFVAWADVMGYSTVETFKLTKDITNYKYAFSVEEKATDEQRQELLTMLAGAKQEGSISEEDILFIKSVDNLKEAELILSHRIEKRRRQKIQEAQENIKLTAEEQRKSAEAAEAYKRKTLDYEKEVVIAKENAQKERELAVADRKGLWDVAVKLGGPILQQALNQMGVEASEVPSMLPQSQAQPQQQPGMAQQPQVPSGENPMAPMMGAETE